MLNACLAIYEIFVGIHFQRDASRCASLRMLRLAFTSQLRRTEGVFLRNT